MQEKQDQMWLLGSFKKSKFSLHFCEYNPEEGVKGWDTFLNFLENLVSVAVILLSPRVRLVGLVGVRLIIVEQHRVVIGIAWCRVWSQGKQIMRKSVVGSGASWTTSSLELAPGARFIWVEHEWPVVGKQHPRR